MSTPVREVWWCSNCEKDTEQSRDYSDHERDSSNDWFECLECGAHYCGITGKWVTKDQAEVKE